MKERSGLVADYRWIGVNGIGRFAREVLGRLRARRLKTSLQLRHPLDPIVQMFDVRASKGTSYFSPGYYAPLGLTIPYAFVIHDLIHLRFEAESSVLKSLFYKTVVLPAALRAHTVFTVSEFSKSEIQEWTGLSSENVVVVGNGVTASFCPLGPKLRSAAPYLLYVGATKPHKNIGPMLSAFAASTEAKDFHLIFSGSESPGVIEKSVALGVRSRVRFLGGVSDPDLAAAYRGATSLLFPSLYEGFGLPALEAMACGTAVVAPSGGALEEITQGAAILCDPSAVESIAAAIDLVIRDTASRETAVGLGKKRAAEFTWERVASRIASRLAA